MSTLAAVAGVLLILALWMLAQLVSLRNDYVHLLLHLALVVIVIEWARSR